VIKPGRAKQMAPSCLCEFKMVPESSWPTTWTEPNGKRRACRQIANVTEQRRAGAAAKRLVCGRDGKTAAKGNQNNDGARHGRGRGIATGGGANQPDGFVERRIFYKRVILALKIFAE